MTFLSPLAEADERSPLTLIERLDPNLRLLVLLALAGIVLIGLLMALFVWWGGRIMRREARRRVRPIDRGCSDWDRKRPLEEDQPDDDSDESSG